MLLPGVLVMRMNEVQARLKDALSILSLEDIAEERCFLMAKK